MPKKLSRIFCAAICALVLAACGRQEAEAPGTRRVFLMYSAAFSNLSPSIHSNEKQLYEAWINRGVLLERRVIGNKVITPQKITQLFY